MIFFVHGGAWRHGDKRYLGVYSSLAMCLARHGLGTVVPNYRLSPAVQHPEHIKDVARAFAWTRKHIGNYGGCPDQIFVSGHSAGAHPQANRTPTGFGAARTTAYCAPRCWMASAPHTKP